MSKFLLWTQVFISLRLIPRSGCAGSYGKCVLNLIKLPDRLPEGQSQTLSPATYENSSCCASQELGTVRGLFSVILVFDFSYSMWRVVLSHVILICIFWWSVMLDTFSYAHLQSSIFLGDIIFKPLILIGLFAFLLLSFESSLYILDTSPLSDKCFENIFSQPVTCIFILLYKDILRQGKSQEIYFPCTFS